MRMIFALPLLALGLAACQTYPLDPYQPYPPSTEYPVAEGNYRAIGTEPFWDLTIGRDLTFTDRGNNVLVSELTPPVRTGFAGETYQGRRLFVNIVHSRCSDGMSDRTYPDTVNVTVDGHAYRGCGANAAFFAGAGENGGPGVYNLANTNWRVVSIDGQPVPPRGYYLNFMPDRVSGRLGCNALGASYRVAGNTLRAGAVIMTQMACPDMRYETQGARIMTQPMTLSESGDRMTLSNRIGTIEMLRAR